MMLVLKLVLPCMQTIRIRRLFLERPGNFSSPKRNFEMEYCIYSCTVNPQSHKPVNFASLTVRQTP